MSSFLTHQRVAKLADRVVTEVQFLQAVPGKQGRLVATATYYDIINVVE